MSTQEPWAPQETLLQVLQFDCRRIQPSSPIHNKGVTQSISETKIIVFIQTTAIATGLHPIDLLVFENLHSNIPTSLYSL